MNNNQAAPLLQNRAAGQCVKLLPGNRVEFVTGNLLRHNGIMFPTLPCATAVKLEHTIARSFIYFRKNCPNQLFQGSLERSLHCFSRCWPSRVSWAPAGTQGTPFWKTKNCTDPPTVWHGVNHFHWSSVHFTHHNLSYPVLRKHCSQTVVCYTYTSKVGENTTKHDTNTVYLLRWSLDEQLY